MALEALLLPFSVLSKQRTLIENFLLKLCDSFSRSAVLLWNEIMRGRKNDKSNHSLFLSGS